MIEVVALIVYNVVVSTVFVVFLSSCFSTIALFDFVCSKNGLHQFHPYLVISRRPVLLLVETGVPRKTRDHW